MTDLDLTDEAIAHRKAELELVREWAKSQAKGLTPPGFWVRFVALHKASDDLLAHIAVWESGGTETVVQPPYLDLAKKAEAVWVAENQRRGTGAGLRLVKSDA